MLDIEVILVVEDGDDLTLHVGRGGSISAVVAVWRDRDRSEIDLLGHLERSVEVRWMLGVQKAKSRGRATQGTRRQVDGGTEDVCCPKSGRRDEKEEGEGHFPRGGIDDG